jgi:hypothetical protein
LQVAFRIRYSVAIMFVQATKSRRGNKTYVSYLVREAFRTPAGPRSRTVCDRSWKSDPLAIIEK